MPNAGFRFANTGKRAPNIAIAMIMNTDAILNLKEVTEPPPLPQLSSSSSETGLGLAESDVEDELTAAVREDMRRGLVANVGLLEWAEADYIVRTSTVTKSGYNFSSYRSTLAVADSQALG